LRRLRAVCLVIHRVASLCFDFMFVRWHTQCKTSAQALRMRAICCTGTQGITSCYRGAGQCAHALHTPPRGLPRHSQRLSHRESLQKVDSEPSFLGILIEFVTNSRPGMYGVHLQNYISVITYYKYPCFTLFLVYLKLSDNSRQKNLYS